MDLLPALVSELEKEQGLVQRTLEHARFTRDHAPSAMESHSDTTRSEFEKLVFALEDKLKKINSDIKLLAKAPGISGNGPVAVWSLVTLNGVAAPMSVIVVPPGLGGRKLGDKTLLSSDSPLGSLLLGSSRGQSVTLNDQVWNIS